MIPLFLLVAPAAAVTVELNPGDDIRSLTETLAAGDEFIFNDGTFQITNLSDNKFEVTARPFTRNPDRHNERRVHIRYLRRLSTDPDSNTVAMQTAAEADEVTGRIDHFTGHVKGDDGLWLGVRWVGCDASLDSLLPATQL